MKRPLKNLTNDSSYGKVKETIIIPDVHQNFRFVEKVLALHSPTSTTRYVFLGDFFDAKEPFFKGVESLKKTLLLVQDLIVKYSGQVTLLLGNHDVVYFFGCGHGSENLTSRSLLFDYYGAPDRKKMTLIRQMELDAFWECFSVVHYDQGFLFSHAGITLDDWSKRIVLEENISRLNHDFSKLTGDDGQLNRLLRAGFARGGDMERGGPVWLDWNREFTEEIGIPQIVGHSVGTSHRKVGRSYCLDARQSCYGVASSGELKVNYL